MRLSVSIKQRDVLVNKKHVRRRSTEEWNSGVNLLCVLTRRSAACDRSSCHELRRLPLVTDVSLENDRSLISRQDTPPSSVLWMRCERHTRREMQPACRFCCAVKHTPTQPSSSAAGSIWFYNQQAAAARCHCFHSLAEILMPVLSYSKQARARTHTHS